MDKRIPDLFEAVRARHPEALRAHLAMYRGPLPVCNAEGLSLLDAAVQSGHRACVVSLLRAGFDPRSTAIEEARPGVAASLRAATQNWMSPDAATGRLVHALAREDAPAVLAALSDGAQVGMDGARLRALRLPDNGPFLTQAAQMASLVRGRDTRAFEALLAAGASDRPTGVTAAQSGALWVLLGRADGSTHPETGSLTDLALAVLARPSAFVEASLVHTAIAHNACARVFEGFCSHGWKPEEADVFRASRASAPQPLEWLLTTQSWSAEVLGQASRDVEALASRPASRGNTPERIAATRAVLLRLPAASETAPKRRGARL